MQRHTLWEHSRGRAVALVVGDDLAALLLPDADAAVGGAKVDADRRLPDQTLESILCRICNVLRQRRSISRSAAEANHCIERGTGKDPVDLLRRHACVLCRVGKCLCRGRNLLKKIEFSLLEGFSKLSPSFPFSLDVRVLCAARHRKSAVDCTPWECRQPQSVRQLQRELCTMVLLCLAESARALTRVVGVLRRAVFGSAAHEQRQGHWGQSPGFQRA